MDSEKGSTKRTLSEESVVAGSQVQVSCLVLNANGEAVERSTYVEAPTGITVSDYTLTAQKAGSFDINCRLTESLSSTSHVPALLEVTAGAAAELEAFVDPTLNVYKPGQTITIKWTATDQYGNVIAPDPAATVTPPNTAPR